MAKKGTKVRIEDLQDIYEYCAGIDVHKSGVTVCAICGKGPAIEAEVVEYGTTTGELRQLGEWLREQGVTQVVMESTGVYWRPVCKFWKGRGFIYCWPMPSKCGMYRAARRTKATQSGLRRCCARG